MRDGVHPVERGDPYAGTVEAVLECAQNLACVGAEPLGLTNCLNFGNPEKPGPAWQLDRAVSGLADACEALGVPVVGGNVSLYNEGPDGPIYPTPSWEWSASCPTRARVAGSAFLADGDAIGLVGPFSPTPAGSELAKLRGELDTGLPTPDVDAVAAACAVVRFAVRADRLASAHDVSNGGLACALAESAVGGSVGCRVDLQPLRERGWSPEEALFGEGVGRVPGQRRAGRAGGDRRHPDRRGRRRDDRGRSGRPQPCRVARRRRERLALAGRLPSRLLTNTLAAKGARWVNDEGEKNAEAACCGDRGPGGNLLPLGKRGFGRH